MTFACMLMLKFWDEYTTMMADPEIVEITEFAKDCQKDDWTHREETIDDWSRENWDREKAAAFVDGACTRARGTALRSAHHVTSTSRR